MRFQLVAVVGAAFFSACQLPLPDDVTITCSEGDACPDGFVCRLKVCQPADGELDPPRVAQASIAPALAGRDQTVLVSLAANEPLGLLPRLRVVFADGRDRELIVDDTADFAPGVSREVRGRFAVSGSDPSGVAQVFVDLTDAVGNAANDVAVGGVGSLTLDTVAPAVAGVSVSPAVAALGDTVALTLTPSEPLDAARVVYGDVDVDAVVDEAGDVVASFVVDGDRGDVAQVALTDRAGNRVDVEVALGLRVDALAPVVQVTAAQTVARGGGTLALTLLSLEPLRAPPAVRLEPVAVDGVDADGVLPVVLDVADLGGGRFSASYTVSERTAEGVWRFVVDDIADVAGNVGADVVVDNVVVDRTAPAFVVPPEVTPRVLSRQPGFDDGVLAFEVAEDVTVVATVGGVGVVCVDDVDAIRCPLDAQTLDPGAQSVVVTVVDDAGNSAFAATAFDVDTTPPAVLATALALAPPPGALLSTVTALGVGASATVVVSVDDPAASLDVVSDPPGLVFVRQPGAGTPRFVATVDADTAEGPYQLTIATTDAVDNASDEAVVVVDDDGASSVAVVVVDRTAPAAPALGAVRYRRTPWGDDRSANPRFELEVAAAPDVTRAFAWTSELRTAALGDAAIADPGGVIDLGAADRPVVFVSVVDAAGNESDARPGVAGPQATRVRNVVWTASLGGKVAGSALENPHRIQAIGHTLDRQRHESTLESGGPGTVVVDAKGPSVGLGARFIRAGSLESVEGGQLARQSSAFDRARGRIVSLLEGASSPWEHSGQGWQQVTPADPEGDGNPAANGPLAFHHPQGLVVHVDDLGTTWGYDGVSWRRLCVQCVPGGRLASLAEHDDTGELVLFGGVAFGAFQDRTFLWNGAWREVCTGACRRPPPRQDAALAYDPVRRVTVLFGGRNGPNQSVPLDDVWEWDGGAWTERTDLVGARPTPRSNAAMAFDPERGALVVVGGNESDRVVDFDGADDVFAYDGAGFVALAVDVPGPGILGASAVVTHDGLALVGGRSREFGGNPGCDADAGICGGPLWLRGDAFLNGGVAPTTTGPAPRRDGAMVFDAARGEVLLFGGTVRDVVRNILDSDGQLWAWNGQRHLALDPPGARPSPRGEHAMAYDAGRGVTVLFGGRGFAGGAANCDGVVAQLCPSVVWEFDGAQWTRIDVVGPRPDPRAKHSLAYDEGSGAVVLYGGVTAGTLCDGRAECDVLWSWDGAAWRAITPGDGGDGLPLVRTGQTFVGDPLSGELLLFGGTRFAGCLEGQSLPGQNCQHTWSFDGSRFVRRRTARDLLAVSAGAAFDPDRQRVVAVVVAGARLDVVEWDGAQWSAPRAVFDPEGDGAPPGLTRFTLAYDEIRRRHVVFGGSDTDATTWLLDTGAQASAAHQFTIAFAAAGANPQSQLVELTVRATATSDGAPVDTLHLWDGGWQPRALPFSTTSTAEIARLLSSSGRSLHVALRTPPLGSAAGRSLVTDAVAVDVAYRLP